MPQTVPLLQPRISCFFSTKLNFASDFFFLNSTPAEATPLWEKRMDFNPGSSFSLESPIQLSQIPAAETSCGWDTLVIPDPRGCRGATRGPWTFS